MTVRSFRRAAFAAASFVVAFALGAVPASAQRRGTEKGEWRYWGADEGSSRYSPLEQINEKNAGKLEVAWRWYAANYGPAPDFIYRATPIKVGERLYTVAGQRRTVVSIDPSTGETLWMWRERDNPRWEASTRKNYGKGVAYAEVEGRPTIFVITPGYYLATCFRSSAWGGSSTCTWGWGTTLWTPTAASSLRETSRRRRRRSW
jgi:glucose dehydrogenase